MDSPRLISLGLPRDVVNDDKEEDKKEDAFLSHSRLNLESLRDSIVIHDDTAFKVVIDLYQGDNLG